MKWREYTTLSSDATPLVDGCSPTKEAFTILDYCDAHGLNRESATHIDSDGHLHLREDCKEFKETSERS